MPGHNCVILVGNVVAEPESRTIPSGSTMTKFRLAVSRRTKNGDEAIFVDIIAWEKLAELCASYLKKGKLILVQGRLVIRSYDDKDGNKRWATEVVINEMQMLGKKEDEDSAGYGESSLYGEGSRAKSYSARQSTGFDEGEALDEVPF
jgi:single-strand DNA-binding protein